MHALGVANPSSGLIAQQVTEFGAYDLLERFGGAGLASQRDVVALVRSFCYTGLDLIAALGLASAFDRHRNGGVQFQREAKKRGGFTCFQFEFQFTYRLLRLTCDDRSFIEGCFNNRSVVALGA